MDTRIRTALLAGAVVAAGAALVFALAPTTWLEQLLALSEADAAAFLLRRYGSSATAALAVVAGAAALGAPAPRVALLGLGTWFGVQGVVAAWGLLAGVAGGLAWVALVGDPLLAAWLLLLARRYRRPTDALAGRIGAARPLTPRR